MSFISMLFEILEYTADYDGMRVLRLLDTIQVAELANKVKFF